jgi:hypothetical protein
MSLESKLEFCDRIFGYRNKLITISDLNRFVVVPPKNYSPFVDKYGKIFMNSFGFHLCIHTPIDELSYETDDYDNIFNIEKYCDIIIKIYLEFKDKVLTKIQGTKYGYYYVLKNINGQTQMSTIYHTDDIYSLFLRQIRQNNRISKESFEYKPHTNKVNDYIKYLISKGNYLSDWYYLYVRKSSGNWISLDLYLTCRNVMEEIDHQIDKYFNKYAIWIKSHPKNISYFIEN